MLGLKELKDKIIVTNVGVECPVKGCTKVVGKQRVSFRREPQFQCTKHKIYISPSTFQYENDFDNMLWTDRQDKQLFEKIKLKKRESRILSDNSEDAVSWNVFRYAEKYDFLGKALEDISGKSHKSIKIIYWSYDQEVENTWSKLGEAHEEFGEIKNRGSEPDIIIVTEKALFFIEAKVFSGNNTKPSNKRELKKYLTGGNNWFSEVFKSGYDEIAIREQKYELLRFWLIGTWIAEKLNLDFYLVNLVLKERETDIEQKFKKNIVENDRCMFKRYTWENIYELIKKEGSNKEETVKILDYFHNKSAGYNSAQELQTAFMVI